MDPRVARSRTRLQGALLSLAEHRPLVEITVADVAAEAGVNRSTFYQHYADLDSLLADALEQAIPVERSAQPSRAVPIELRQYLDHIAAHHDLYRQVFAVGGASTVRDRLGRHLTEITGAELARREDTPFRALPVDISAAGVTGAIVGVISAWVEHEPLPPAAEAERWIRVMLAAPE